MPTDAQKDAFAQIVSDGPANALDVETLAQTLKNDPIGERTDDRLAFAGVLAHAAFAAPDRTAQVYDAAARGWCGGLDAEPIAPLETAPSPLPEGLMDAFWALVADATAGKLDAIGITTRSAALGGLFNAAFQARVGEACLAFPGVKAAAEQGIPAKFTLDQLADGPDGSLSNAFYRLITEKNFDLEVLDRDELGLEVLPFPIAYLNVRALQCHDLWHIAAGYETTALHEIAISGWQMGQFGHSYSAMFLAVTAAIACQSPQPGGFNFLMDVVLSGWKHGRETPPILGADWEGVWHKQIPAVREALGVQAYASPYPADIIEQMQAA